MFQFTMTKGKSHLVKVRNLECWKKGGQPEMRAALEIGCLSGLFLNGDPELVAIKASGHFVGIVRE